MVKSVEDRILIEIYTNSRIMAIRLNREFPGKGWTVSGLKKL